MVTYYRVQPASRNVESLLRPGQVSRAMVGQLERLCDKCNGHGDRYHDDELVTCTGCKGVGRIEDVRAGVSVCLDLETLAAYFTSRALNVAGDVLVELEGEESEDEDHDAADGALLIHPTRIVSVTPVEQSPLWSLLAYDGE